MGLLVALWRDRTFQSISLTILMVVFSVAGVEAFARRLPDARRACGVPLAEVLNPYRAVVAVLYPRSDELARRGAGVEPGLHPASGWRSRRSSSRSATFMLRIWNPGRNEPREQREGEGEAEVVETLVEVDEDAAEAPVAVGVGGASAVAGRGGRSPRGRRRGSTAADSATGRARSTSPARRPACTSPGGPTGGSPRPPARTAGPGPTRSSGAS